MQFAALVATTTTFLHASKFIASYRLTPYPIGIGIDEPRGSPPIFIINVKCYSHAWYNASRKAVTIVPTICGPIALELPRPKRTLSVFGPRDHRSTYRTR